MSMMEHEHDSAGNALRAMREASCGYTPPVMHVSATRRCTLRWQILKPIFINIFIWRTIFCSPVPIEMERHADLP